MVSFISSFEKGTVVEEGVNVKGAITVDSNTTGTHIIPANTINIIAIFPEEIGAPPYIHLTPLTPIEDSNWIESVTCTEFTIKLITPQSEEIKFHRSALVNPDTSDIEVRVEDSPEPTNTQTSGEVPCLTPSNAPEPKISTQPELSQEDLSPTPVATDSATVAN